MLCCWAEPNRKEKSEKVVMRCAKSVGASRFFVSIHMETKRGFPPMVKNFFQKTTASFRFRIHRKGIEGLS
jgi:hypothetical protein